MRIRTKPRVTEAQRARHITEKYRTSPRVYFIYVARTTGIGPHLLQGTDHKRTAKLIVAQQEALGHQVHVYCAQPAHFITWCVYQTERDRDGDTRQMRALR